MQYAEVAAALAATGLRLVSAAPVAARGKTPDSLLLQRVAERRDRGAVNWEVYSDWLATAYFRGQRDDSRLAEFVDNAVNAVKTLDYIPNSIQSEYLEPENGFRNAAVNFTTWHIEDA